MAPHGHLLANCYRFVINFFDCVLWAGQYFLYKNILGLIPTTFSFLMCVSFITYLLERKK
jgi:hypothetical protein